MKKKEVELLDLVNDRQEPDKKRLKKKKRKTLKDFIA